MIVIGEFNTHLGRNVTKTSYHENSKTYEDLVDNIIHESNLFVTKAYFKMKPQNYELISLICVVEKRKWIV